MKYLLPDAIQIEKILSHDEESSLMYPDLKITLTTDFLGSLHANQSPSMVLCKAFHTSVLKFVSFHPKVDIFFDDYPWYSTLWLL